jgi:hypothetical protein
MDSYYMREGYAMVATGRGTTGHWFGGEPYHRGAQCPVCKLPLLLLADLDCSQIRTRKSRKLFDSLDRLPFYYCWRCCAEHLTYLITDADRVKVLRNEGEKQGDTFPYEDYPVSFPKRAMFLVPIRYELAKLLAVYQEVDEDWLSGKDRQRIKKGIAPLRHSAFTKNDVNRHQLGGVLPLIQGHESVGCPNAKCKRHKSFKEGYAHYMKELAVFCNDPHSGLPMVESLSGLDKPSHWNEWVQVIFWVCEECLAIAASNRCD